MSLPPHIGCIQIHTPWDLITSAHLGASALSVKPQPELRQWKMWAGCPLPFPAGRKLAFLSQLMPHTVAFPLLSSIFRDMVFLALLFFY